MESSFNEDETANARKNRRMETDRRRRGPAPFRWYRTPPTPSVRSNRGRGGLANRRVGGGRFLRRRRLLPPDDALDDRVDVEAAHLDANGESFDLVVRQNLHRVEKQPLQLSGRLRLELLAWCLGLSVE